VQVQAGSYGAGLVAFANYYADASLHFINADDFLAIRTSYAVGSVTVNANQKAAGLVYRVYVRDGIAARMQNSYARNVLKIGNASRVNLIGAIINSYPVSDSFWIKNPGGKSFSTEGTALSSGAQLLADMQCASGVVDSSCAKPTLLVNWSSAGWNFGTKSELPYITVPISTPWLSADTPNDGIENESIANLSAQFPNTVCQSPRGFIGKAKNSGYVFHSSAVNDKLAYFNAADGLECRSADQGDASCDDYQLSYLCDERSASGAFHWTNYFNLDSPTTGAGDRENPPANPTACSVGLPLGVRYIAAFVSNGVNTYSSRIGPKQRLVINSTQGLLCLSADNPNDAGCYDYEVRMSCSKDGPK